LSFTVAFEYRHPARVIRTRRKTGTRNRMLEGSRPASASTGGGGGATKVGLTMVTHSR